MIAALLLCALAATGQDAVCRTFVNTLDLDPSKREAWQRSWRSFAAAIPETYDLSFLTSLSPKVATNHFEQLFEGSLGKLDGAFASPELIEPVVGSRGMYVLWISSYPTRNQKWEWAEQLILFSKVGKTWRSYLLQSANDRIPFLSATPHLVGSNLILAGAFEDGSNFSKVGAGVWRRTKSGWKSMGQVYLWNRESASSTEYPMRRGMPIQVYARVEPPDLPVPHAGPYLQYKSILTLRNGHPHFGPFQRVENALAALNDLFRNWGTRRARRMVGSKIIASMLDMLFYKFPMYIGGDPGGTEFEFPEWQEILHFDRIHGRWILTSIRSYTPRWSPSW
jgi:hypothetical protein